MELDLETIGYYLFMEEQEKHKIETLTDCISSLFDEKSVAEAETVWNDWYK